MQVILRKVPVGKEILYEEMVSRLRLELPLMGTLGGPSFNDVELHKVSHLVKNVGIKDNCLWADIEITETHAGQMLKCLIERCVFRAATVETDSAIDLVSVYAIDVDVA